MKETDIPPTTNALIEEWQESDAKATHAKSLITAVAIKTLNSVQQTSAETNKKADLALNKMEGLLRQFDTITSQAIADYVEADWIKELAETYDVISSSPLCPDKHPQVAAQLQKIERRLEDAQVQWIRPKTGDDFDGKLHQPIKIQTTPDKSLHGKVAQVFANGIARSGQVLTHARVATFRFQPNPEAIA